MNKIDYEKKLEIYNKVKEKVSVTYLSKLYGISRKNIYYTVKLIDKHGKEILQRNSNNKKYSTEFKENAIKRVLENHEPLKTVAIDIGLSSDGQLNRWVKIYKENGYNIVERKRGRPIMAKPTQEKGGNQIETDKEKIKRLEEENLYLKAELEYSKKLRAVVQARKNQQQKKK